MRKVVIKSSEELENITKESIERIGIRELPKEKSDLLLRLIFSGISKYFFLNPDHVINLGFLKFKKNPKKEEMFTVEIIKSDNDGIINADTLWRYYTGELAQREELKSVLNEFVNELLNYSQMQEVKISKLTNEISKKKKN